MGPAGERPAAGAEELPRPSAATLPLSQSKPTILRVKRRRGAAAPEEIILEATSKRIRPLDALATRLASMGMAHMMPVAEELAVEVKRRRRFQIVRTVGQMEFHSKSGDELLQLLSASKEAAAAAAAGHRTAVKGTVQAAAELGREQRRMELSRHRQQQRYQQV